MDELSITPEELRKIMGESDPPLPSAPKSTPASSRQLSQEEINRMIAAQGSGTPASPSPARAPKSAQITPEELAQITGSGGPNFGGEGSGSGFGNSNMTVRPAEFAPLRSPSSISSSTNLDLLLGVTLKVTVELGRTKLNIEEILKLGPGSVVELDKLAGEPVDVLINDRMIAKGEVVVIDDRFGVRITDVISPAQRLHSLQ